MAGEAAADRPGMVTRIESLGRAVTPEDVWNAAVRAGADPARVALSLSHVLGEVTYEETVAGREDDPAAVRYTLTTGEVVEYDAGLHNPFKHPRALRRPIQEPIAMADSHKTVLFLCTGNYYRSRHAEAVFNHRAAAAGLPWRATSRGLALERGVNNHGPLARSTISRLSVLGVPHEPYLRMPASATHDDFAAAHLVVALKDAEHRPLMVERHPAWVEKVEFWHVHDVDFATPDVALPEVEEQVDQLIARLATRG